MTATVSRSTHVRRQLLRRAILDSFVKLNPRQQVRNPVMFVVEAGSVLTTLLFLRALIGRSEEPAGFVQRRWPKGAAKHRQKRCAGRGMRPLPRDCMTRIAMPPTKQLPPPLCGGETLSSSNPVTLSRQTER